MLAFAIISGVVLLCFANGANDNFKGVATLYGSGTVDYRRALVWATLTTAAGSIFALWFAETLLKRFSGKGLVAEELVATPAFAAAVALGAGLTVLLATRFGFPISTTHALVGAMVGVAVSSGFGVQWQALAGVFLLPLLASPLASLISTCLLYSVFRAARLGMGMGKETCLCAGLEIVEIAPLGGAAALARAETLSVTLGTPIACRERYAGRLLGVDVRAALDLLHYLSSGLVCFARGLNDTPKLAAILLSTSFIGRLPAVCLCGVIIAVGGLLGSRRIAESLGRRITDMNPGQGFTANLVTGALVTFASGWGLPVSTTHVSCGALFGIGAMTRRARWSFIGQIVLAWVTTLPVSALLAAASYRLVCG